MKKDITDLPSGVQAQIRALETLAILLQDEDAATAGTVRQLAVAAHMEGGSAEIEFVTALEGVNGENMGAHVSNARHVHWSWRALSSPNGGRITQASTSPLVPRSRSPQPNPGADDPQGVPARHPCSPPQG